MCWTYHRCSTPISIPIPVKYADDAAYRAKRHLDAQHIENTPKGRENEEQRLAREKRMIREMSTKIKVNENLEFLPYYV